MRFVREYIFKNLHCCGWCVDGWAVQASCVKVEGESLAAGCKELQI